MPELKVVKVPTADLMEYQNNAKLHPSEQIDQIASSIEEFGFNSPILAWHNDDGDPEVIAGHGRLMAARKLGMEQLPVVFLDHMTEQQRRAYILADNQLTMNSGFDLGVLTVELEGITAIDMSEFGFDMNGILSDDEIDEFFVEATRTQDNDMYDRHDEDGEQSVNHSVDYDSDSYSYERQDTEDTEDDEDESGAYQTPKTVVCPHCGKVFEI